MVTLLWLLQAGYVDLFECSLTVDQVMNKQQSTKNFYDVLFENNQAANVSVMPVVEFILHIYRIHMSALIHRYSLLFKIIKWVPRLQMSSSQIFF
jgi:hypothetical protein